MEEQIPFQVHAKSQASRSVSEHKLHSHYSVPNTNCTISKFSLNDYPQTRRILKWPDTEISAKLKAGRVDQQSPEDDNQSPWEKPCPRGAQLSRWGSGSSELQRLKAASSMKMIALKSRIGFSHADTLLRQDNSQMRPCLPGQAVPI